MMKHLLFIVLLSLILVGIYDSSTGRGRKQRDVYSLVDSLDTTSTNGKATTPSTRTPFAEDSILKHMNFIVRYAFGTQPLENIADELPGGWALMRDSSFVLRGKGCLVFRGYRGSNPSVPDTIEIEDTCQTSCYAWRSIPLGCYDSLLFRTPKIDSMTVCDSNYYLETYTYTDSSFALWSETFVRNMRAYTGGCTPTAYSTVCLKRLSPSQWIVNVQEVLNPGYPWKYCSIGDTCDSDSVCCVSIPVFWSYLHNYGYWYIPNAQTVTVIDTFRTPVPKGIPGAVLSASNCRTAYDTSYTITKKGVFVPAGRDTLVYVDTCDPCIDYKVTCDQGHFDSALVIRPRFDTLAIYDTTYDTIPCVRSYSVKYNFRSVTTYRAGTKCVFAEEWDAMALPCDSVYSPGKVPVATAFRDGGYIYPMGYLCWSCNFDIESWTPDDSLIYCWVDTSLLYDRCGTTTCSVSYDSAVVQGGCCSRDTAVTVFCYVESSGDIIGHETISWKIPDWSVECNQDTIKMNIKIIGWADSLVGYDTSWSYIYIPGSYRIVTEDTCLCIPYINGKRWCGDLWIVTSCGDPVIWEGNTLILPCPTHDSTKADAGEMAYLYHALLDSIQKVNDSLLALKARVDSLEASQPVCGKVTLDGSGEYTIMLASEPRHISMSYTQGGGTDILYTDWTEGILTIRGTANMPISYCYFP